MRQPGRGSTKRSSLAAPEHYADLRRIVVAFDEDTFALVRDRALAEQTSFAEQIRRMVEWGLESPVCEQEIEQPRKKPYSLKGRYGYRKSKPACLNGSERRKGPKSRPVAITLAERA